MSWTQGMVPPDQMSQEEYMDAVKKDRERAVREAEERLARQASAGQTQEDTLQQKMKRRGMIHGDIFPVATRYGLLTIQIDLSPPPGSENFVRAVEVKKSQDGGYHPVFTLEDSIKVLNGEIVPEENAQEPSQEGPLDFAASMPTPSSESP